MTVDLLPCPFCASDLVGGLIESSDPRDVLGVVAHPRGELGGNAAISGLWPGAAGCSGRERRCSRDLGPRIGRDEEHPGAAF